MLKNRADVTVDNEWVESFANKQKISKDYAKFLLCLVVGFDNVIYLFQRIGNKVIERKKK